MADTSGMTREEVLKAREAAEKAWLDGRLSYPGIETAGLTCLREMAMLWAREEFPLPKRRRVVRTHDFRAQASEWPDGKTQAVFLERREGIGLVPVGHLTREELVALIDLIDNPFEPDE